MKCYRVWFRFLDDPKYIERCQLVDAETLNEAFDDVAKRYDNVHIFRIECLDE